MDKVEMLVVDTLKNSSQPLTLVEIAQKTGQTEKKIFKVLRKLFEHGTIKSENHRYMTSEP
jgi:predicted transcriptional regulator